MRQPAGYGYLYKKMLSSPFRIGFYGVFADSRLFAHASLDFHLYFSSVRGLGGVGGEGVMTSMRMRIVCCVSLVDLVLVRHIGGEGGEEVMCFSCCFVFCALVGRWEHFNGFCGVFVKFLGGTVPTFDFSHMPAWTSMRMHLTSVQRWGGGGGMGGADDIHANVAYSYYFSFCSVNWQGSRGFR